METKADNFHILDFCTCFWPVHITIVWCRIQFSRVWHKLPDTSVWLAFYL